MLLILHNNVERNCHVHQVLAKPTFVQNLIGEYIRPVVQLSRLVKYTDVLCESCIRKWTKLPRKSKNTRILVCWIWVETSIVVERSINISTAHNVTVVRLHARSGLKVIARLIARILSLNSNPRHHIQISLKIVTIDLVEMPTQQIVLEQLIVQKILGDLVWLCAVEQLLWRL